MKSFNLKQKLTKAAKDEKGFTFMEVVIVIAIIMVLSAILIPSYFGFVETARKSNVKVSAQNVYSTIQIANIELGSIEVGNETLFNKIKELVPGLKGINATDVNVDEDIVELNGNYTGNFGSGLVTVDLSENQFAISAIAVGESGFTFTYYQCLNGKIYVIEYTEGVAGEVKSYTMGTSNSDQNNGDNNDGPNSEFGF